MRPFLAIIGVLAYSSAQAADPVVDAMIDRWDKCFNSSTRSQFTRKIDAEPNMVAEIAFQACATEEEALMVYLTPRVPDAAFARSLILKRRTALKKRITG